MTHPRLIIKKQGGGLVREFMGPADQVSGLDENFDISGGVEAVISRLSHLESPTGQIDLEYPGETAVRHIPVDTPQLAA